MDGISIESFLKVGFLMSRENDRDGEKTPSPSTLRRWFDLSTYVKKKQCISWDRMNWLVRIHASVIVQRAYRRWCRRKNKDIIQLYLSF